MGVPNPPIMLAATSIPMTEILARLTAKASPIDAARAP